MVRSSTLVGIRYLWFGISFLGMHEMLTTNFYDVVIFSLNEIIVSLKIYGASTLGEMLILNQSLKELKWAIPLNWAHNIQND